MRLHVVDHPIVAHKLTTLRDSATEAPAFRRLVEELVTLLGYEAMRSAPVAPVEVCGPLGPARGVRLGTPPPLVVPVLRAGVGMLDGFIRLLPDAEVGFAGLARDHLTLQPSWYAARIPAQAGGRDVVVLDPMLATGGTLVSVLTELSARGATRITCVCLLAAPEGLARVEAAFPGQDSPVSVVLAAVDERLDERGYILPGLGDAGDRLFGVADPAPPPEPAPVGRRLAT